MFTLNLWTPDASSQLKKTAVVKISVLWSALITWKGNMRFNDNFVACPALFITQYILNISDGMDWSSRSTQRTQVLNQKNIEIYTLRP